MTDLQLKQILDWIPEMLLAIGVLATTLVGLYIQIRTKLEVKELKEQSKEIIKQTDGINTSLQNEIKVLHGDSKVFMERISGLEQLLASQKETTKIAVEATTPGPQGETGPQGEKGDKGKGLLG